MSDNDDFWGGTPDWTNDAPRPERGRRRRGGDATSASSPTGLGSRVKAMWGSAMSSGADATREHRIIDATVDPTPTIGRRFEDELVDRRPTTSASDDLFFDIDETFPTGPTGWSGDDWHGAPAQAATTADDRTGSTHAADHFIGEDDFAPVNAVRSDAGRAPAGGVDPLLARIGAAVVVLTLIVPLAVGLRSNGVADDLVASADTDPVTAVTNAPIVATADTEPVVVAETYLDPSQLPPAVPVNTEASDSQGAASPESEAEVARDQLEESATSDVAASAPTAAVGSDEMIDEPVATKATGTTVADIASPVDAGDRAERVAPTCGNDYTVVEGDFWIRLADASDVALADLLAVNGATVDTPLYPGRDICLPVGADTPAPPATVAPAVTSTTTSTTSTTSPPVTTAATTTTTTQPPTTEPPATAAPTPAGPADIEAIIREVWPDDLEDRALEIAFRESRYVPTAKNYCCYGLFQIYWSVHQGWLADLGITDDQQLYDPATNARAAYALYQRAGGWGPWSL